MKLVELDARRGEAVREVIDLAELESAETECMIVIALRRDGSVDHYTSGFSCLRALGMLEAVKHRIVDQMYEAADLP